MVVQVEVVVELTKVMQELVVVGVQVIPLRQVLLKEIQVVQVL